MMQSKYRPILTSILLAFIVAATGLTTPVPVYAQVIPATPVQINGIFNPDTIYPSQISRLTINVYNPNSGQLTAVNWSDSLPDDLIIVDPANPVVTGCGSSYSLTATPNTNVISLSGATTVGTTNSINPGICSVTVSVTSFTAGNHDNVILKTHGSVNLGGVVSNYESNAKITILVLPMSIPVVAKSFSPNNVSAGMISLLTITVKNPDTHVALTQVALQDTLPSNMFINDTAGSLSGCGAGTFTSGLAVDDTQINITGATIAVGGTCTIRVNVKVTGTGTLTNVIPKGGLTNYQQVTIPSDVPATLTVENIRVNKYYSPDDFQVGGKSTLYVELTNPDTINPLTNVHFSDTLKTGLSVIAGTGAIVTPPACTGTIDDTVSNTFTLNGATIPPGETCVYHVGVESSTAGPYPNTLDCSMITFDGPPPAGCVGDSADLTVYDAGLGLTVTKSFQYSDIAPGTTNQMTIRITAPGDTALSSFNLTDHLPADVYVATPPNASTPIGCGAGAFNPVAGSNTVSLTNADIAAGATCVLRVYVTSSVYGPHTNTISSGDITNTSPTGQRNISADATESFTVRDISVKKSFANGTVGRNGITTLTITLTNNYTNPLTGIEFTDTLPGDTSNGIIIATPLNFTNTCNGTVTANPLSQQISLSVGTIDANQSCTITVDVQGISSSASPSASYTNNLAIGSVTGYVNGITLTKNWHAASAGIGVGTPDFRINKKFDPILVTGDTASTMTITLVNTESSPVSEIAFTDTLPPHMLLAVPSSPSVGSCGGVITPAADRKSFTFSGGALAGNAQCKLTIRAMMEITGNLINTIPALSVTTRQGMTNLDPTSATLTNLSSVGVTKHFEPNPVSPGSTSTLILDIQKNGLTIGLTGLKISDTLLNGLTIAPTPAVTNTCSGTLSAPAGGTLIQLTDGVMPIGSKTCRITVDVLVPDTGLHAGGYQNCIPVGTVVTDQSYTNVFETCDTLGTMFDPPTGYKVFDATGLPQLEWRMVWINDHNSSNINAQVRDPIPTGTTYVAGSLDCTFQGTISSTTTCVFDAVNNQIVWTGVIGPDRGATNEATANNEIVITFRVDVPSTVHVVNNRGTSITDTDGDSDFLDETTSASNSVSNLATWYRFGKSSGSSDSDVEAKSLPASGFAPAEITILPLIPTGLYDEMQSMTLEIPTLGVRSEIVGINSIGGKWDVTWLGEKLGYLEESAFPTWSGNSVITGHVFDAQGKPGPFNQLHSMKYGDRITISSFGQVYTYEVRELLAVAPDDIKAAFKHRDNSWVTLLTCQGFDPESNTYQSRVLVRAVLIDVR